MEYTNQITRYYRICRVVIHTLLGLTLAALAWPFINKTYKNRFTSWWSRRLLAYFNIRVVAFGDVPNRHTHKTMFIANHISWVDIHAFNSVIALRFIAKSEISQWPVFGYFAKKSGTIFINRNHRKDAVHIIKQTAQALADGDNIGFSQKARQPMAQP